MILILIGLTLLFPFLFKYQYLITNQFTQIPIINSILDPTYLTNDWYVTISRSFGPRTIFAYYMAFVSKLITLPGAFFLNYLIYIFLIAWSAFQLTQLLFKDKYISLFTTLFILFGTTYSPGGNILITHDFSAPQLPLALILTTFVFMFQEKIFLAILLLVIATYLHPLLGWEGGTLILVVWSLPKLLNKKLKTRFLSILKIWLLFILLTLPLFLTYFSEINNANLGVGNQTLINILAYSRNPHHYIATSWPLTVYLHFLLFLGVSFFSGVKSWPKLNQTAKNIFKQILLLGGLILGLNLIGFIFTEILPIYQIVAAQLFRSNLFIYFLAAMILYGGVLTLVKTGKLSPVFLVLLLLINQPDLTLRGKSDFLTLFVFLLAGWLFVKNKYMIAIILLISAFYFTNFHMRFSYDSYFNQSPTLTRLTNWVKTNTPTDSVFIIPPQMEEFRLLADRAVVADWKAFPFQKQGMWQWHQRMCDIGNIQPCQNGLIQRDEVVKGFLTHTEPSITELTKKYQAQYLISYISYPHLQPVFTSSPYIIYKLIN